MQLTIAALQEAEDLELGTTEPFPIDQARIAGFADATEDHQWIHVDVERAKDGPYGGTIAHGYLVMSLIPYLFFKLLELPDSGMVVNYGLDKLRFMSPVPEGSSITLTAKHLSGQKRLGGVLCRLRCTVRVAETGKRAVMADLLLLVLPPKDEDAEKR